MLEYVLFVLGLALLIKGADYLIDGGSALAKRLGVSSLVIGLTVIAFGTSMPELFVNIFGSIKGSGDIVFGNIIGSNISNILLILGISAMFVSIKVKHSTAWREIPFSFIAAILLLLIVLKSFYLTKTGMTGIMDGVILLVFFALFIVYIHRMIKEDKKNNEFKSEVLTHSYVASIFMIIAGIAALALGGKWTVDGAIFIAKQFGISEYFISATIVAVGTSLPELVTSIKAALRKDSDIAVGNIVGSNIFNILLILGLSFTISPITIPKNILFDVFMLLVVTIILFIALFIGRKHEIKRWQGAILVLLYVLYVVLLLKR